MDSPRQPIEQPKRNNGLLISIVPEQFKQGSHDRDNQVRELPQTAEYITLKEHIAQYITHHIGSV